MIATKNQFGDGVTFNVGAYSVEVPDRARTLSGFRAWALGGEVPEKARVDFYRGKVWVEMGGEQVYSHGLLKTEFAISLGGFIKRLRLGKYWCNGILVSNLKADWSGNPDGTFVSHACRKEGRIRVIEGAREGHTELVGSPDMVLEVVSPGSVTKDKSELREAYWEIGIPEFWLVDARGERLDFQILKHGTKGYVETRKVGGWLKSGLFGKSFKLARDIDEVGDPEYTLEIK